MLAIGQKDKTARARLALSLLFEEFLHQRATLFFKHARSDLRLGMERLGRKDRKATLGVAGAVDKAAQLRPADSAGTHDARLDGDVERTLIEILTAEGIGGTRDGLHLGMSGNVGKGFGEVVAARYNLVAAHNDNAYRNLVAVHGHTGLVERPLHVVFVGLSHREGREESGEKITESLLCGRDVGEAAVLLRVAQHVGKA